MSSGIPAFGSQSQFGQLNLLLTDSLNGMGDFLTQEEGSLNWCEALVNSRAINTAYQFLTLLSNQVSPESASIYLNRWANVFNCAGLSDPNAIENFIELKQAQFGTPASLSNMNIYLTNLLGSIFLNIQWAPELQQYATSNPFVQISEDGGTYNAPLQTVYVYVWQPRDNQDNLLMPTNQFNNTVSLWQKYVQEWCPSGFEFITLNLTNRGFQDGYGNNYNGLNYNNYLDGYNVISGTAGSTTLTGVGTAFLLYPNGQIGDFAISIDSGFTPPIQIVDDTNTLQTYYVLSVQSNTSLTLTTPLINNVTSRTYRCLGEILDQNGMLDGGQLSSNGWII